MSDGHAIIACGNDTQFARLIALLGAPEMAQDERYRTNAGRVVNRDTLIPRMFEMTAKISRAELLAKLEAAGVPGGPINTLEDRLAVMAALGCVDLVTWFDEDTPLARILEARPDVLVKGGDWAPDRIVGAKEVLAWGGQVHSIPFEHQRSTTALLERIAKL